MLKKECQIKTITKLQKDSIKPISFHWSLFIPPENSRKPLCLQYLTITAIGRYFHIITTTQAKLLLVKKFD